MATPITKADLSKLLGTNLFYRSGKITTNQNVTFNKVTINELVDKSSSLDSVATVGYVNNAIQGMDVKDSVKCATTSNLEDLSGITTVIDGIHIIEGDRVLVKNQTDASHNGIYVVAYSKHWTRSVDFDEPNEVQGAFVFVEEGSDNGLKGFIQVSNRSVVIGKDALNFTQFNGTDSLEAGNGITQEGNTLNVDTSLNFVKTMTGLEEVVINGTLDVSGRVTGPTISRLDASMSVVEASIGDLGYRIDVFDTSGVVNTSFDLNGVAHPQGGSFNSAHPAKFTLDNSGNLTVSININGSTHTYSYNLDNSGSDTPDT
jgi:hypothetical protein